MDTIKSACNLFAETEARLRILIGSAAESGQYEDVAKLAAMAKMLGQALNSFSANGPPSTPYSAPDNAAVMPVGARPRAVRGKPQNVEIEGEIGKRTVRKQEYPRFERDGDRLVKLGWSKKDKSIYEHRAPKDVAATVSSHLSSVPYGEVFRMDDKLPVELQDGATVPLYQAYLVLAWLRDAGLVDKRGKDGYLWLTDNFDDAAFESAWAATANSR